MRRICKYCGKTYDGDPGGSCCPDCAAAQRKTTIRDRLCRECGRSFPGGPRAWYCPDCRRERKRYQDRQRRKTGTARSLGSTDICVICGNSYTVEGGNQKYCKSCADAAVREIDRRQSIAWNRANTTPEQRRADRQTAAAEVPCVICGKLFIPHDPARTCSPACARELRYIRQARADLRRGKRKAPIGRMEHTRPQSGVPGVTASRNGTRWCAAWKGHYIGTYDTIQAAADAIEAYKGLAGH